MFTGLIETVGRIRAVRAEGEGIRIAIETALEPDLATGDSLAVNGVCLTVTSREPGVVCADIGPETMRVTTLGRMHTNQLVNLERSMRADGRFGGHFVQGHVDAAGTLDAVRVDGDAHWLTIGYPAAIGSLFIPKGSVAVDGISLTIAALRERQFDVMIVPFTWEHTNLSALRAGDPVNLECDMIGKYVARMIESRV